MTFGRLLSVAISGSLLATPALATTQQGDDGGITSSDAVAGAGGAQNMLTVTPLSVLLGNINISYETARGEQLALLLGGDVLVPLGGANYSGGGVRAGVSFYPFGKVFEGLFITPAISLGALQISSSSATYFSGTMDLGYRWRWSSGFTLGLGGGLSYTRPLTDNAVAAVLPRLVFDLGGTW